MGDTDWLREQGFDDPNGEKDPGQMLIDYINKTERSNYIKESNAFNRPRETYSFDGEIFTKQQRNFTRQRTMAMTGNIDTACQFPSYEYYLINSDGRIAKFIFSSFNEARDFTKVSYRAVLSRYNDFGNFSVTIKMK